MSEPPGSAFVLLPMRGGNLCAVAPYARSLTRFQGAGVTTEDVMFSVRLRICHLPFFLTTRSV